MRFNRYEIRVIFLIVEPKTSVFEAESETLHCVVPGVRAGHALRVDIVTQLLSTVVYPSPDVDLVEPQQEEISTLIHRIIGHISLHF